MKRKAHLLLAALALLSNCSQDTDNTYCSLPASFHMDALQAPALYTACQSMGEFCTITTDGKTFTFKGTKITSQTNINTVDQGYYLGLSGLLVGLPNIPELGSDQSKVTCYDLACSNCYEDYNITKRLTLLTGGYAKCSGCGRTYDLNNQGMVSTGEGGKKLFRYRTSYVGTTLIISN